MRKGLILLSTAAVVLAGCGSPSTPDSNSEGEEAPHNLGSVPLTNVVESVRNAAASMDIVTHISRSGIDDTQSEVTTSVFVPKGDAPEDGFPIVALSNRTTGIAPECAPSLSPTLLGLAPTIEALLKAHYVVAVPDFQGLGKHSGEDDGNQYNPYLDSTTAGYNIVDAVQAARVAVPQSSASWLPMGIGEGGQAAWAANELADNYSYELELAGSVSISPISDINGLLEAAKSATLSNEQKVMLARFLAGLKAAYPDAIDLDQFRRGAAQQHWDALLACQSDPAAEQVAGQIPATDLQPADADAASTLQGFLSKATLPQGPTRAPMLVVYNDGDPLSPGAWTDTALNAACKLGDTITIRKNPQPQPDSAETLAWIGDRFKSEPAPNDCEGRTK